VGDINLPHTPFPPARSPPNNFFFYFLQSPYLFTIDRLFPSIVEMFRINSYRVSLDFIQNFVGGRSCRRKRCVRETQSMQEIRLLCGGLPRKGGRLTGLRHVNKKLLVLYFLQLPYLFTIDRLFSSIVEMFRINFYRVSLDFIQPVSSQESEQ
jgi:hypothetical protein